MSISALDAAHVTVCEEDQWSYTCLPGSVISITSAQYGRSMDYVCGYNDDYSKCISSHSVITTLQNQCNRTNTCDITVSVMELGNTQCWKNVNYLNFTFQCISGNKSQYTSVGNITN